MWHDMSTFYESHLLNDATIIMQLYRKNNDELTIKTKYCQGYFALHPASFQCALEPIYKISNKIVDCL